MKRRSLFNIVLATILTAAFLIPVAPAIAYEDSALMPVSGSSDGYTLEVIENCSQEYILEYDDSRKEIRRQFVGESPVPWATGYSGDRYESQILTVKEGFEFPETYIEQFQNELTESKVSYWADTGSAISVFGWTLYSSTDVDTEMVCVNFKEPLALCSFTDDHVETTVPAYVMKYDTIGLFTPQASQAGMPELEGDDLTATFVSDVTSRSENEIVFDYSLLITGEGTIRYCDPNDPLGFLDRKDKSESCEISISREGTMTIARDASCLRWHPVQEVYTEIWEAESLASAMTISESSLSGPNMEYSLTPAVLPERIPAVKSIFDVMDYGAVGDGVTLDTGAINDAIDACADEGGIVYFPPGTYLSGSLHMQSNVTLKLDAGAVLLGTRDMTQYDPREENPWDEYQDSSQTFIHRSLIWGENLTNVGFIGPGTINGNDAFEPWGPGNTAPPPPLCWIASTLMYQTDPNIFQRGAKPISLKYCNNVLIKDISIQHAPDESVFLAGCNETLVDRYQAQDVRVDGIDPVCCRNFTINHCEIQSLDDAVAIKSSYLLGCKCNCENITVKDSLLSTFINALKIGTESVGDFINIRYHNCIIHNAPLLPSYAGISLISVDGGIIEDFAASDITMRNVGYPIFMRLGDRFRSPEPEILGTIQDISLSDIIATGAKNSSLILGVEEKRIGTDVNLSNIDITCKGGGKRTDSYRDIVEISESDGVYPDPPYLLDGEPPAYGFYLRHVDGITFNNLKLGFEKSDRRAAFVCDGVYNLVINGFDAERASFSAPSIMCDPSLPESEYAPWPMHPVDSRYRGANALSPGDVNQDGYTDYLTNYEFDQKYVVVLHPGDEGDVKEPWPTVDVWEPEPPYTAAKGVNPENAALGDFDGDGNLDVVGAQGYSNILLEWWEGSEPGIRVVWGPDAGDLLDANAWTDGGRIPETVDRGHFHWVVPHDVNGDGATDIVAGGRVHGGNQRKAGVIWVEAPGNPDARRDLSLWQVHDIDPDQFGGHGFVFTDVDQDGDNDIVLANADFDTPENEEKVLWYENPGSGTSGILTIRPTSDHDVSIPNVRPGSPATHWDKLDDAHADGTTTEVWTGQAQWRNDLFGHNFDENDYPDGDITSVRIYATLQTFLAAAINAKPILYDGTDDVIKEGTPWSINPGYKLYEQDITGLRESWNWDDIRDSAFGVSLKMNAFLNTTGCTQVYMEVDYAGPEGTGSVAQRNHWPVHVIYQDSEFSVKPQVVVVDLDGDGLNDVLTQTEQDIYYFRKTSIDPVQWDMIVIEKDPAAQYFARTLKVADLNGDGKLDIFGMLVHEDAIIPPDKAAAFWMEYGGDEPLADNWTTHAIKWGSGQTNVLAEFGEKWDQADVIDVDGDGDLDIVANCEEWWEDGWGIYSFWDPNASSATAAVVWFENRLDEEPYTFDDMSGISDSSDIVLEGGVVKLAGGLGEEVIAFSDDFEGPQAPCYSCLEQWHGGNWGCVKNQSQSPTQSAWAGESHDDFFYTDEIDLSDATEASLEFWYRHYGTDTDDFTLYFYDGTGGEFPAGWNIMDELGRRGADNQWHQYSIPIDIGTYGIPNFEIAFDADLGWVFPFVQEQAWIDDVVVTKRTERATLGALTSVTIAPDNLDTWGTFTATHTLPAGTDIIYSILDASCDCEIVSITAAQAAAGYDMSSTVEASSIKLRAILTGDGTATPMLDEWQVTWSDGSPTPCSWNDTFDGLCVIEAENYTELYDGTWVKRANYEGYGGDGYMQDHNAIQAGAYAWNDTEGLEYAFDVKGGLYYLWARQWVPAKWGFGLAFLGGQNSNSAWIGLDGEPINAALDSGNGGFDEWYWIHNSIPIYLSPGTHTINLRVSEGGYALDKVILTPDVAFVPSSEGPCVTLYNP